MSLNVKNDETERLVRELAARTGESFTGAITESVRQRLDRLDEADARAEERRIRALETLSADSAPRWTLPHGSTDHAAMLYDEQGLPA